MDPSTAGKEGEGARAAAGFGFKVRRRWSEVQWWQMGGRGAAVPNGMGARGKVGGDGRRGGQEAADGEGRSPAGQCEARWASAPGRVAHMSAQTRSYRVLSRSGFTMLVVDGVLMTLFSGRD